MELKERLDCADGNDYFIILSSYMAAADNGDEVIDALCEFAANCRTFEEPGGQYSRTDDQRRI